MFVELNVIYAEPAARALPQAAAGSASQAGTAFSPPELKANAEPIHHQNTGIDRFPTGTGEIRATRRYFDRTRL